MKEKFENQLGLEMKNMQDLLNKQLEGRKIEIEKEYENKYKNKEKEMENKFNEMSKIMQQKVEENSKNNISICKTTHHGIKCEKCSKEPICGFRYKCSQCNNYNLCQDCEEKNSLCGEHPHDFIKIRKEEKIINFNKDNNKLNNNNYYNMNNYDVKMNNKLKTCFNDKKIKLILLTIKKI